MRVLVLVAFFALQLSVFTCGFDTHIHALDSDIGHIAQHAHDSNSKHESNTDHGCHVHTSHTFVEVTATQLSVVTTIAFAPHHGLKEPSLKNIPFSIEYPPKA